MKSFHAVFFAGAALTLLHLPFARANLHDLPDNTARDLGGYTCSGAEGAGNSRCRSITDYSRFTYDPVRRQMLMFGGGHSATMSDYVDVFSFNTLTWAPAYPSTPCSDMTLANWNLAHKWNSSGNPAARHTYDLLPITKDGRYLILLNGVFAQGSECGEHGTGPGSIAHYDIAAKTWAFGTPPPWGNTASGELDPVSGKILVIKYEMVYTYDPSTRVVAAISNSAPIFGYADNLAYFPPNDKFYYIKRGNPVRVWEISVSAAGRNTLSSIGSIVEVTGMQGTPSTGETGFAYDSVNQVIGGGVAGGVFHAFNPLTKIWTSQVMQLESQTAPAIGRVAYHALDYSTADNVYIFITEGRRTWAYRYQNSTAAPILLFGSGFE